jgi:lipopolysaccharide export system protein LptA
MTTWTKARLRDVVAALVIGTAITAAAVAQPNKQAAAPAQPTQSSAPNALQGFSQNRDQPVKIESARLEVRDKEKKATFAGDVHLTQGDVTLTCKTLIVFYEQNAAPNAANPSSARVASTQPTAGPPGPGGQSQIRRLEAIGDVVVVQKEQTATGNTGTFDMKTNTITLEGNVVVTQGMNVVRGERMVVDMTTGVSRVEPSKGGHGRVEGLFLPGSAKDPTGSIGAPPKDGGKLLSGPMKLN